MVHAYLAMPRVPVSYRVAEWLIERSTGRRAVIALVLFVLFVATVLPWQAGIADSYSAGIGSPDRSFWYSADRLYAFAEAYGADGRSAYVLARLTFDLVWPVVYAGTLVLVLGWELRRTTRFGSPWRLVVLLPIAALLADYAENLCTAIVMARWPETTAVLAHLAPVCTAAKWLLLGTAFVLVPLLVVRALWVTRGGPAGRAERGSR